jgi:mannose-6-phosphate isomerase-like protein (cupin superfamily)
MQYVRPVDFGAFRPGEFHSQFIASLETCLAICSRVPAGLAGPSLHVPPSDQLYYVLRGRLQVQLGPDLVEAEPDDLVFIPAGVPHRNINPWDQDEVHFELIAPAPPPGRPLLAPAATDAPTEPVRHPHAGVRRLDPAAFRGERFQTQPMADRSTGSEHVRIYVARVPPGGGGPTTHVHEFDQLYFVLRGTMQLEIALGRYTAGPNTLVVLPAGVPHTNWNDGPEVESHLALLAPTPPPGMRLDHPVTFAAAPEAG